MKKFLLAATIALCLMSAGCFQAKYDLIITDDGAVVRNWKMLGTAPFSRQIEQMKANNERLFPNLKLKPIAEGDMLGYAFSLEYPDLESFAKSYSELYNAHAGKSTGVSRREGWFFDAYAFDFYCTVTRENLPPEVDHVTQAALTSLVYELTVQLPYAADFHDADEVSADGKVLTWKLAPLLIKGGERNLRAQFKIWHREKIFLTAAIGVLMLAGTIFFGVKARREESVSVADDFRFKRNVFGWLFISLALVAAYVLLTPIVFTEADIISAVVP
ncbi:MAG: LPXTG cell wall anchor domain-containing protein [Quinella sp. 2Q5]|nr:LPXTG cell wall anchor domain-containing protein [Quinella sp. 2Q5]